MCGRYNVTDNPLLRDLLREFGIESGPIPDRFNIAPTEQVPVIYALEGAIATLEMRWWLVPHWSEGPSNRYAMFNARCENLRQSPAFREPFRRRRCLIPASSFIEWQKRETGKQAMLIASQSQQPLLFAGIWDCWQGVYSCSIVTTAASREFSDIHARQPVLLSRQSAYEWLNNDSTEYSLLALCDAAHAPALNVAAIDERCNNARNKEAPHIIGPTRVVH